MHFRSPKRLFKVHCTTYLKEGIQGRIEHNSGCKREAKLILCLIDNNGRHAQWGPYCECAHAMTDVNGGRLLNFDLSLYRRPKTTKGALRFSHSNLSLDQTEVTLANKTARATKRPFGCASRAVLVLAISLLYLPSKHATIRMKPH